MEDSGKTKNHCKLQFFSTVIHLKQYVLNVLQVTLTDHFLYQSKFLATDEIKGKMSNLPIKDNNVQSSLKKKFPIKWVRHSQTFPLLSNKHNIFWYVTYIKQIICL